MKSHLEEIKSNYIESIQNKTTFPQWHPPPNDPVTMSSLNPDDWCLANAWSYMWDPLRQYKSCGLDTKTLFTCKKCGLRGNLHYKGYRICPAFMLDKIV